MGHRHSYTALYPLIGIHAILPFQSKGKIISGLSMAFYGFLWLFDGRNKWENG